MKKILLLFLALMVSNIAIQAQQEKNQEKQLTKFEEFSSKTGVIVKFVDTALPNLPVSYSTLQTGIRTIMRGSENAYFYRLEEPETSRSVSHIAMVEYSDLVEINKAISRLVADVDADVATNPDYLENKFRTADGFEIGYYVSKQKPHWYIKLERYSSSTVFLKSQQDVVDAFKAAQTKIEELKASFGK